MKHAMESAAANPFDIRALWGMDSEVSGGAENGYRAWLENATRMHAEAAAFWNGRLGKDVATLTTLGQCRNPGEAFETQMQYAREAMADYYAEGQRLMQFLGMPATGNAPPTTNHRRTAHQAE